MEFLEIEHASAAVIKVFGVGGGGGNAVNNMINSVLRGVTFVTANTDVQALNRSQAEFKIQLGEKLTKGLGAGANPEIGRDAALESMDQIKEQVDNCNMVFVTAGMGGGTGTGAAPVIAEIAREAGALTVGVVTKPFHFEGERRMAQAERGIAEFRKHVDSLITIPNNRLLSMGGKKSTFLDMLKKADEVLYFAVKGISDLIMVPGLINLDFADVQSVMSEMGMAMMGSGVARGENRATEAAMRAITSPLLEDVSIDGARGVLINVTCGMDITIEEVDEASRIIKEAAHQDADIFWGAVIDQEVSEEIRITVIATGIESEAEREPSQAQRPAGKVTEFRRPEKTKPRRPLNETREETAKRRRQESLTLSEEELKIPTFLRDKKDLGMDRYKPGSEQRVFDVDDEMEIPAFMRRSAD